MKPFGGMNFLDENLRVFRINRLHHGFILIAGTDEL